MTPPTPRWLGLLLAAMTVGCGGSSSTPTPAPSPSPTPIPNTVTVTIDGGPVPGENIPNRLYADVTVCVPGGTECQTIDGVMVDTGSYGLRLLASAVHLSLPKSVGPGGSPLAECLQFVTSSTWGSVRTADVKLAGETAPALPVQLIGDPAVSHPPTSCTEGGFEPTNNLSRLGAKGILGVGSFVEDCGPACTRSGASNPGLYYECTSSSKCHVTTVSLSHQVSNPVAFFAQNNNGVVITLPPVTRVAQSLTGSMSFGIGTETDNALGAAKVFTLDRFGYLKAQFHGKSLPFSFVDSGSFVYYFADSNIERCDDLDPLYCPKDVVKLSATMVGANGTSAPVPFSVENADTLFKLRDSAFATLASANVVTDSNAVGPNSFDWGLPFYFGRTVFTSIDGRSTPAGSDAFVAW